MNTNQTLRVTVFGASGNIGRHVVDQLLSAGHTVTAYVRNPAKLTTTHPNLIVIEGGLDDPDGVAGAVDGADAVISALGADIAPRSHRDPGGRRHSQHRGGDEGRRRASPD